MDMQAVARATRRQLSRWGMLLLIASQLYLSRGFWAQAAHGNAIALGSLTLVMAILGWAVRYRIRWAKREPEPPAPSAGRVSGE